MNEPYILISIEGGIVQDVQHTLPCAAKIIIQTSDDSLLDASLKTMWPTPTTPIALNADVAHVVRTLAKAYVLPGWTDLTDQQIVDKLLTGAHDMHPSEDGQNLTAAIAAIKAGHRVLYDGSYLVSEIETVAPGQWEIYHYNDSENTGLGEIKTCPGDFNPDDLIFTITATD